MPPTDHLIKIIKSFKENNLENFEAVLNQMIQYYEEKGKYNIAKKLRDLNSRPYNSTISSSNFAISNTGANKLYEHRKSNVNLSQIILSRYNSDQVNEILLSFSKRKILIDYGIPVDSKVLVYGPPGTGKTLLAYAIAGELNIPILHIYIDELVSSLLGDTGKNIRSIFEEASKQECLIFLDEFDAIAKNRDDDKEVGELKRVVTVLLQNIDAVNSNNILFAATNHEHLLDSAIRRRFTYEVNLEYLDESARKELFQLYLKKYKNLDVDFFAKLSNHLSGASIKDSINKSLRKWVLENEKNNLNDLILSNLTFSYFQKNKINTKSKEDINNLIKIIKLLRKIDSKRYTYKYLENLTAIPDSTLINILKKYNDS